MMPTIIIMTVSAIVLLVRPSGAFRVVLALVTAFVGPVSIPGVAGDIVAPTLEPIEWVTDVAENTHVVLW